MAPEKDIGWQFGESTGDGRKSIRCKFCGKVISGGITRLKEHIALVSGNVERCTKAPREVSLMLQKYLRESKSKKSILKKNKEVALQAIYEETQNRHAMDCDNSSEDEDDDTEKQLRNVMRESRKTAAFEEEMRSFYNYGHSGAGSSQGPKLSAKRGFFGSSSVKKGVEPPPGFESQLFPSKQKSIKKWFAPEKVKRVGTAISKWFIFNHITFHAVDSGPYYQSMIKTIAKDGKGIDGSSGRQIGGIYLDEEVEEIRGYIGTLKPKWKEYGCTIMCDDWSTRNKHPIINFMIYCDRSMIYHTSIDCTNKRKTAEFLLSLMNKVIDEIGEENIVHVVTDSESANKAAGERLMLKRPHLFWFPCAAHCIDLMLEDIGKMEKIKKIIGKAKSITSFIYNSDKVVNLMKSHTNDRELLRPGITRFATEFVAIESLCRYQMELKRMCTTPEWKDYNNTSKRRKEAENVSKIILDARFWKKARKVCAIMEPLVKVLKLVDQDKKPTLSIIYEAMDRAKLGIKDGVKDWNLYWNVIDDRWYNQLHQHLHAAAYFLNPILQYSGTCVYTDEVRRGLKIVVKRLERDINAQAQAINEITSFTNKMGEFGSPLAIAAVKTTLPAEWWINYGEEAPNLRRIAIRVLSQTCSSSGCERNWSTWSLIHTKLRNRLAIQKLHKLVYCHYNMRLKVRNFMYKRSDDDYYSPIDLNHIFHDDDILDEWTRENEPPTLGDDILDSLDQNINESQDGNNQATPSSSSRHNEQRSRKSLGKTVASTNSSDDNDESDDSDDGNDGSGGGNNQQSDGRHKKSQGNNTEDDHHNAGMSWAQGRENYYATQDTDHGYRPGIEQQRRYLSSLEGFTSGDDYSHSARSFRRHSNVDEQMQSLGFRENRQRQYGDSYGSSNDNRVLHQVDYNPGHGLPSAHGHFDGYSEYHGANYGSSGGSSGHRGYDYSSLGNSSGRYNQFDGYLGHQRYSDHLSSGASGTGYRGRDYGSSDSTDSNIGYRGSEYYHHHNEPSSHPYPFHSAIYNASNQPTQLPEGQFESSHYSYPHALHSRPIVPPRPDIDDFVPPRHSTWY